MIIESLYVILMLALILASCAVFVNAIEHFGHALKLHQGIVGSILAAVGTALPETIIPIIAILFSQSKDAHEIGIGAIAGAPFMLGTLAFFVTGAAVICYAFLGKRTFTMNADVSILAKDLSFFICIYTAAVGVTIFHDYLIIKSIVVVLLLCSYAVYLRRIISSDAAHIENVETLYLTRYLGFPHSLFFTVLQLAIALGGIVVCAHYFIIHVDNLSAIIHVPALILSIIITPVATELPEKFNSVIWVGRKKDTLALGNITGAMVFQSCFPVAFGILFTRWELNGVTIVSALLALISASVTLLWLKITKTLNPFILLSGGIFYVVFLVYVFIWGK